MNLNEFVTETLVQIQVGVHNAIHRAAAVGVSGAINPGWGQASEETRHPREVAFDVAVTATEGGEKAGKGGIRVWGVGIGGEMASHTERTHVSRIQFTVPILLPTTDIQESKPIESGEGETT